MRRMECITKKRGILMQESDWVNVKKQLPKHCDRKYLVKTKDGIIKKAFFMPDKAAWRVWYGQPTSYWLETPSAELILDVVEWSENNYERKS